MMSKLPPGFAYLLRALPAEFRARHRAAMQDLMASYTDAQSGWSRATMWLSAAVDILWVGLALRIQEARGGRSRRRGRRGAPPLDTLVQDVRHSLRSLRRDWGLATLATLIVGLGIGASSTVFSVANALLLRPLPFEDPGSLVWIANNEWGRGQQLSSISVQVSHLWDLQNQSRLFSDVAGVFLFDRAGDFTLTGSGEPERLTRLRVTENLFPMLGVRPQFGRLFTPEDVTSDAGAVLLSHGFWARRIGADPEIVGRTLTINNTPVTVVGVLPASFDFTTIFAPGSRIDFVAPFPLNDVTNRQGNTLALIGRLQPGATMEAAQAEATAIAARPYEGDARRNDFVPRLSPLREHVSGGFRPAMILLTGSVGLVMLIVCANLSNLLLARGVTRQKEIAIRAALGADRRRLIRQMLTESALLAFAGAALGLLLALAGTQMLANSDASIPLLEQVRVDGAALGFTVLAAIVAGLVFGLTPAVSLSAVAFRESLKEGGRGQSEGKRRGWMRGALVVSEVALACVLLVGAGLLMRSFFRVLDVDLGFQPRGAVTLRIDPQTRPPTAAQRVAYFDEALRRVNAAPGVEAAGLTDVLPVAFNRRWGMRVGERRASPFVRMVSEGYLRAMGISLVAGRDFSVQDNDAGRPVMVVNEMLAQALWPGEDPIGRSVTLWHPEPWEVIGVVRGMRHLTPEQEPGPEAFFSIRQNRDYRAVHLIARGSSSLANLTSVLRDVLRPLDPNLPMNEFRVIQDIIDKSTSPRRFLVLLLAGFAVFALVLASVGIYGVISYSVSQRSQEIGIRSALGASPGEVQKRILIETLRLALVGTTLGLFAAWILARVMEGLLFGVTSSDWTTFLAVPVVILTVATLAGYLPARRAARLDPVVTLRADPRSGLVG